MMISGSPTPSMTAEAMEWIGLIVVTTLGASAFAAVMPAARAKEPASSEPVSKRPDFLAVFGNVLEGVMCRTVFKREFRNV